jgi:hypothetical protein
MVFVRFSFAVFVVLTIVLVLATLMSGLIGLIADKIVLAITIVGIGKDLGLTKR